MNSRPMIMMQPALPTLPELSLPAERPTTIRRARASDVEPICQLVNYYAALEIMLPKTQLQVYSNLRMFMVADAGGIMLGCAALKLTWANPAEIVSLAVRPELRGHGLGRELVTRQLEEAREIGEPRVFALTLSPGFFSSLGFHQVEKHTLPHKVWNECSVCPKRERCDEIAMLRAL